MRSAPLLPTVVARCRLNAVAELFIAARGVGSRWDKGSVQ